jgi:hypothetical protein
MPLPCFISVFYAYHQAEQTIKVIPEVKRAEHFSRAWSKDVDLADYYANMENNFL